jgi:uncharacterized protein
MSEMNESTPPPMPEAGGPSAEEKQWGMFAHLSPIAGAVITSVVGGWGFFLGPLVIWLMKKDTLPWAANEAKEALNFSILVSIIMAILVVFGFVTLGIGFLIAAPIMGIVGIAAVVLNIIGAMKANEGVPYRYPANIRFIK